MTAQYDVEVLAKKRCEENFELLITRTKDGQEITETYKTEGITEDEFPAVFPSLCTVDIESNVIVTIVQN